MSAVTSFFSHAFSPPGAGSAPPGSPANPLPGATAAPPTPAAVPPPPPAPTLPTAPAPPQLFNVAQLQPGAKQTAAVTGTSILGAAATTGQTAKKQLLG